MKQVYLTILLALTITIGYSQKELQIEFITKNCCTPENTTINSFLKANHQFVLYKEGTSKVVRGISGVEETRNIVLNHMFRDLSSNTIWSREDHQFLIKEQMELFKWTFTQETDTILGYACKKANSNFRGRDYSAWFTTELSFKAAPWKICNLPGVVLKLESRDGFYSLEANKLSVIDSEKEIKTPFNNAESISWNQYTKLYKKKIKESQKRMKALSIQYGRKYDIPYPKLEIIIETNKAPLQDFLESVGLNQ